MSIPLRGLLVGLIAAGAVAAQNPGYEFRGDRIYVDQPSQWRNWSYQNNMVSGLAIGIDSTGLFDFTTAGVKPKYLPAAQNYVLTRKQFTYLEQIVLSEAAYRTGFADALSNPSLADNVGDDDATTYWEPAAADFTDEGMRNWMVEINLGQSVWADSIVVLFPPVGEGVQVNVPLIPDVAELYSDLTLEQQLAVDRFGRRVALDAVVAEQTILGADQDTLVAAGDTLVQAGAQLPRALATIRKLNLLGIGSVMARGMDDPGDVPKTFAVSASMGNRAGDVSSKNYRFKVVGRDQRLGEKRRFVYPLEPLDTADFNGDGLADATGSFVQLVRFLISASDLDQIEFLGEDEEGLAAYEALAQARQGRKAYYRKTEGAYLKQVTADVYAGLSQADKGPVRYYKRELPRVAEIQVWGRGPNIAYRPDLHAGVATEDGQGTVRAPLAFDGAYVSQSRWPSDPYKPSFSTNGGAIPGKDQIYGTIWADFGATFWVNRLLVGSLTSHETSTEGSPYGYSVYLSDGTALQPLNLATPSDFTQLEYGLAWKDMVSEIHIDNWDYRARLMEEKFDLRRVRFMQFRHVDPRKVYEGVYGATGYFNEIQMYGQGYPAEVSFVSPPIVLQRDVGEGQAGTATRREVLSQIVWNSQAVVHSVDPFSGAHVEAAEPVSAHPELKVQIQSRTSDTVDSLITYYEITGVGTASQARAEVDVVDWQAIVDLWTAFRAWDNMPTTQTIRLQAHRTGRDDDGDKAVDEDPVDGVDNDGDHIIDEDGLTGQVGGPTKFNRTTITIAKHASKADDDGDGAVDEDVINGMDDDGDYLIDEDGLRKNKPRSGYDQVISPYFASWSPWSQPYAPTAGQYRAEITSPSPRKFLQLRVNILSENPDVTGRVTSLQVDLSPPISQEVAGELAVRTPQGAERPVEDLGAAVADYAPPEGIQPLQPQAFSYFVRAAGPDPGLPEVAAGFNQILLLPPFVAQLTGVRRGQVEMEEVSPLVGEEKVRVARRTQFLESYTRGADGKLRTPDGAVLDVHEVPDSVLIRFPTSVNAGYSALRNGVVELQFEALALRDGAQVLAAVRAEGASVFQRVESEGQDVTELVDSQTSVPRLEQTRQLLQNVQVGSALTPNGDGVNDELQVRFSVLHLRAARPLVIRFFDLAGRLVRSTQMEQRSGTVEYAWDGRTDDGATVLPGVYACEITLEADDGDVKVVRLVNVAY